MIVTDENVAPLYLDAMKAQLEAAGAQASAFVQPAGKTTAWRSSSASTTR